MPFPTSQRRYQAERDSRQIVRDRHPTASTITATPPCRHQAHLGDRAVGYCRQPKMISDIPGSSRSKKRQPVNPGPRPPQRMDDVRAREQPEF